MLNFAFSPRAWLGWRLYLGGRAAMMSFVRWFSFVLLAMLPLAMAAPARAQGFEQVIDAYLAGEDAPTSPKRCY